MAMSIADSAIPLAAALFLVLLAAYIALLALREVVATRTVRVAATTEHALLRERIAETADRRRRELEKSERTWDGFRKFVIARKELEARDTRSFYLEPHDRRPLPSFMPGQYLTFRLPAPGSPKPIIRCYSLSDAPKPDYFRVTIKRIGPPPNNPDGPPGASSSYFHDELEPGDIVDVKAPAGQFFLDPAESHPAVLIGGGIGLTPVLSMLNAIVESDNTRDVYFFYGVRNRSEHAFAEHLKKIASERPEIQLHVCYSDPTEEDIAGEHYHHAERVSVDLMKRVLSSNAHHFYMCGPPPMMKSVVEDLLAWGVPQDRIHHEAFGPASVKSAAAPAAPAGDTNIEVVFTRTDKKIPWDGRSTLLEVAEANGIRMDFGCRSGNCGTCLTALKTGEVKYPSPPGCAVEKGSCLACIALPGTNVTIDA
jgi:ferredoxin-NADP reductase